MGGGEQNLGKFWVLPPPPKWGGAQGGAFSMSRGSRGEHSPPSCGARHRTLYSCIKWFSTVVILWQRRLVIVISWNTTLYSLRACGTTHQENTWYGPLLVLKGGWVITFFNYASCLIDLFFQFPDVLHTSAEFYLAKTGDRVHRRNGRWNIRLSGFIMFRYCNANVYSRSRSTIMYCTCTYSTCTVDLM